MSNEITNISNLYPKPEAAVPNPKVFSDDSTLILTYNIDEQNHAIITFQLVHIYKFGAPNDEALGGHPLFSSGLRSYSVYEVNNSKWIDELEKMNSVHPMHTREWFLEGKKHLIFTFHDSTFECVVSTNGEFKPNIVITQSKEVLLNELKTYHFI